MSKPAKKKFDLFPEINDLKSAQDCARQGTTACVLVIIATTAILLISQASPGSPLPENTTLVAIELMIYAGLAVMIYRKSRVASVAALSLYLIDRAAIVIHQIGQGIPINGGSWFVPLLFISIFINSIRGTFAYHRLRQERQEEIQSPDSPNEL